MADVIENMSWGEGILAKIGYEGEEDYEQLSQEIAKSYRAKQQYESGEIDSLYDCGVFAPKVTIKDGNADNLFYDVVNGKGNAELKYVPHYDTPIKSGVNMCRGCVGLTDISGFNLRGVTNANSIFYGCTRLKEGILDMPHLVNATGMFYSCTGLARLKLNATNIAQGGSMFYNCAALTTILELDLSSVTDISNMFYNCTLLHTLFITNLGKSSLTYYPYFSPLSAWGSTEEGRQSLIDSLITNSYNRASNGMSACRITLHANVKALLTTGEKAAITAKGFTIA